MSDQYYVVLDDEDTYGSAEGAVVVIFPDYINVERVADNEGASAFPVYGEAIDIAVLMEKLQRLFAAEGDPTKGEDRLTDEWLEAYDDLGGFFPG